MLIQVNTDNHITGRQQLVSDVETVVEEALSHFSSHITRVEVHLTDVNSRKTGPNDKRCLMEARVEGHPPVAVSHQDDTLTQAMVGAADKLQSTLEHTLGRLERH